MLKRVYSRGLSTVIATLLIITLAIVLVSILWVVMRDFVSHQSKLIEMQKEFFAEGIEMSFVKINGSLVSFSLKKIGGKVNTEAWEEQQNVTGNVEVDIISVVDISGSMVSKLSAVQDANKELINILFEAEGNRIGLVGYSTTVHNSAGLNLTSNVTQLNNKIDSWHAEGSTCICCGINDALKKLQQQSLDEKAKKIILMSDGEANVNCNAQHTGDAKRDAIKASCDAKGNLSDLIIYTIGFGGDADNETLINISNCGGGKYFSALNISELIDAYRNVAEEIKYSSKTISKFNYLYVVFYNETSSYKEKILEIPEALEIKNYHFDLTGKLEGNITKIGIYPVIISDENKEVIGPIFDSWESNSK